MLTKSRPGLTDLKASFDDPVFGSSPTRPGATVVEVDGVMADGAGGVLRDIGSGIGDCASLALATEEGLGAAWVELEVAPLLGRGGDRVGEVSHLWLFFVDFLLVGAAYMNGSKL